jgi:arginyl-tRNA synthetase
MSTYEKHGLTKLLESFSISTELPINGNEGALTNPLDVLRGSLAGLLIKSVDCQAEDAYKSIHWPNDISNGDLSVTLPRLRPGCKPQELSSQIVDKV